MKVATLRESPKHRSETINLIERSFGYDSNNSFETDFYPLINPNNSDNIYILLKENEVIGHVATKKRWLAGNNSKLCVLLLGGICIKEEHRKNGYLSILIDHVTQQNSDVALMMLWSGSPELYEHYGFHLCINQYEYQKTPSNLKESRAFKKARFKELKEEEKRQIISLFEHKIAKKFSVFERSHQDWKDLAQISSTTLYYRLDNERIIDYFIINKGQDLHGIIHETTIHPSDIDFADILEYGNVWSPIESQQIQAISQYASLVKIHNVEALCQFLQKENHMTLTLQRIDSKTISINVKEESFALKDKDFLPACFGPSPTPIFPNMKALYIPGVDSI